MKRIDINRFDQVTSKVYFPGFTAQMIHTHLMTFAMWQIESGAKLPLHNHPHEQVVNMLDGEFMMILEGEQIHLRPGDVLAIPPNARHEGYAITFCRILDVFSPRRDDYIS